jgi:uncharacterized membrane protein
MAQKAQKTRTRSVLYIFTYLLLWLSGIVCYIVAGEKDKNLKFHSLQAILLGIVATVIGFIPFIGLLGFLLWIVGIVVGVMAYEGRDVELPIIGPFARKHSS